MIRNVAIVGAGFSGTLMALNLLRHDGPAATLIERGPVAGKGLAYGAAHPDHLLNVRAANMSAFPDDPDHLMRWLSARDAAGATAGFIPRLTYGDYLQEMLGVASAQAPDRLRIVRGEASDIVCHGDGVAVSLTSGDIVTADAAILAVGNLPPHDPAGLENTGLPADLYRGDPWSPGLADGLRADDTVFVIGTGLTMVDVVLSLDSEGFRGSVVALSRRGLLPHRHVASRSLDDARSERPQTVASTLVRTVRARGRTIGWHHAIDELRPFTQSLWANASDDERARFLRHLRPWWDIHRHRLAPAVADRLSGLIAQGRLRVVAGKAGSFERVDRGVAVTYRPRGTDRIERLIARRIVNCTGPQGDLTRVDHSLLSALSARGTIRPDAEHLGIDVDPTTAVVGADGHVNDRIFAIGPMTRGAFWEIVAVPDIRRQVWDLARRLSNAHWVGGEGL